MSVFKNAIEGSKNIIMLDITAQFETSLTK